MDVKLRTSLIQYVRTLQDRGPGVVRLDRASRAYLRSFRETAARTDLAPSPLRGDTPSLKPLADSGRALLDSRQQGNALGTAQTKVEQLSHLRERALVCAKCAHLAAFRQKVVFGTGNPEAELMFVGEAPGADEDRLGEPFVGRAGELLTKMLVAMGLSRERVYIANVLKCRPDMPAGAPGNRKPTQEEMQACSPYLMAQINIIKPRVLVGLGAAAVEGLLGSKQSISRLRGQFQDFRGTPLMPTFHPSYLLHNPLPAIKRQVWEDLLQVMERLGMAISDKQRGYFQS